MIEVSVAVRSVVRWLPSQTEWLAVGRRYNCVNDSISRAASAMLLRSSLNKQNNKLNDPSMIINYAAFLVAWSIEFLLLFRFNNISSCVLNSAQLNDLAMQLLLSDRLSIGLWVERVYRHDYVTISLTL